MQNIKSNTNIFIHIPKCGGSSFVGLLKDSVKITLEEAKIPTHRIRKIGTTEIKHIDFSTPDRKFRSPQIFNPKKNSVFIDQLIFMMVRNPQDRLLSEFNFQYHILNGRGGNPNAAIISSLRPLPHTFDDYIKHSQTQNYQCKFLLGRKLADPKPITDKDFDQIIAGIQKLNIQCGITSQFQHFLNVFTESTTIKLKTQFTQRKRTPDQLKRPISIETGLIIKELNTYDFALFEYIKKRIANSNTVQHKKYTSKISNQFIP